MKKIILSLLLLSVFHNLKSQNINYYLEYSGSGDASNIVGNEVFTYTKTAGGTWLSATITRFPIAESETILTNSQTISNHQVLANPISSNYSVQTDVYGSQYATFDVIGPLTSLTLTRKYNASTNVDFIAQCLEDSYPLSSSSIPADIQVYLNASTNIQSNNSSIKAEAESLAQNYTSVLSVVQEVAKWIRGNIQYHTASGFAQDAASVYSTRTITEGGVTKTGRFGNCEGFTNLTIAMLRSIGIPARYVAGVVLPKQYTMPYGNGGYITVGGSGPGAHAVHEIYYPSVSDWVRGDGQSSVHFGGTNFIKLDHGPDSDLAGHSIKFSYSSGGTPPVISNNRTINSSIGSVTSNYTFLDMSTFGGTNNSQVLLGGVILTENLKSTAINCGEYTTGIYDKVKITSATEKFTPGLNVSYSANFTSGWGDTWPVRWNWYMNLHHKDGIYELEINEDGFSSWAFTTNSSLPDYEWIRDPSGNIYGEVRVLVEINDGDWKSDHVPISVQYKPNKPVLTLLDSDENTITFRSSSDGATSYKVYYGLSAFPPFSEASGYEALEGISPISIGSKNTFSLTDIRKHSAISVTGVNQYGESDYSNTLTYAQYADIPYSTGFESYLDEYWTSEPSNTNGCRYLGYGSNSPHSGNLCLAMAACNSGTYASNYGDMHLNIHNEKAVMLDFWWKDFGDEYHADVDGIWFSDNGGSTFTKVYNLNSQNYTDNVWSKHVLNISTLASQNNLSLTKNFIVRFAQKDNYSIPTDGFAFDDISVYSNYTPPSPITSNTLSTSKDAWLYLNKKPGYEYIENTNYGTYPMFKADEWTHSTYRTNSKSVIQFDLSAYPTNTIIKSAHLTLYANNPQPNDDYKHMSNLSTNSSTYKSNACWLKRITEGWDENSVTYNTAPQTTNESSEYLPVSESYTQNYVDFDVTRMVDDMIKYPDASHGFMLELVDEIKYTRMAFASSDHVNSALHPKLTIEYYIDEQVFNVPFTHTATTAFAGNDWDVQGSDGEDYAHLVYIPYTMVLDITTCSGLTDFDTKIEIFKVNGDRTGYYIDDDIDCLIDEHNSSLYNITLTQGYYYIVVDGFDGDFGVFQLDVDGSASSALKSAELAETKISENQNSENPNIKIYPNPVKDELYIITQNMNAIIKIVDMNGRIIKTSGIQSDEHIIDCSKISQGIYVIQIISKDLFETRIFEKID